MRRSLTLASLLTIVAAVGLWGMMGPRAQAANSSSQVVFSGTGGVGSFGPFGFWIWCQPTNSNAYGIDCAGSMYFYALHPASEAVEGTITGTAAGGYTMSVHNETGTLAIDCMLANVAPITHGNTNSVIVSCSSPAGTGTISNSVVTTGKG